MKAKGIGKCAEDVLSYALFPLVAEKFFAVRDKAPVIDENGVRTLIVEDLSEKYKKQKQLLGEFQATASFYLKPMIFIRKSGWLSVFDSRWENSPTLPVGHHHKSSLFRGCSLCRNCR